MVGIEIVNYGPEWEKAHEIFAKKYFGNRRRRYLPHYQYWKFRGKPGSSLPSLLLAVCDQEVVGRLGLVPSRVKLEQKKFDAYWTCDLMVSSDFRGKGIANMLYTEAVNTKILFGSDPSPSAAISMERFGFRKLPASTKLFYPLNPRTLTDKILPKLSPFANMLPNPMLWLLKAQKGIEGGLQSVQIDESQIDFDWIESMQSQHSLYVDHNKEFYEWRMRKFMDFQDDGIFYQIKKLCFAAIRINAKSGFIGDFYSANHKVSRRMLRDIILHMHAKGVEEIKFLSTQPELIANCKRLGFITGRSHTDLIYCSRNEEFNQIVKPTTVFEYTTIDSDENI